MDKTILQEKAAMLEAVLFAGGEPVEAGRISAALEVEEELLPRLASLVNDRYEETKSALHILRLGDSYQLATREAYAECIRAAMESKRNTPLSQAAMEVLALVAYNQPVTKGFIEQVRGVDSGAVVNTLVERGLLEEQGRLDLPGRPIAYRTSAHFLRCFGISSIQELPPLPRGDGQTTLEDDPSIEESFGMEERE